jgi:HK97 family phage prohead protease
MKTELVAPRGPLRRATGAADLANSSGRIVRYLFSDPSVARDNHTIRAWDLGNFKSNAVLLWCHDTSSPPIGKVVEIEDQKGYLRGAVEYADADVYPFADTIYQLVRGGYVNAVSVSWDPVEWEFSKDRSRPNGIDFKLAELLEISNVPVPALPSALATARSNGIDTGPLYAWAERVLDTRPRGLIVPRRTIEQIRKESRMPAGAKSKKKVEAPPAEPTAEQRAASDKFRRGLYEVAQLASALNELGYVQRNALWEAESEGDGSQVPAQLAEAMTMLGKALVAMTAEEVAEFSDKLGPLPSGSPADATSARYVLQAPQALTADEAKKVGQHVRAWLDEPNGVLMLDPGVRLLKIVDGVAAEITAVAAEPKDLSTSRAGKVVSKANAKMLRDAHELVDRGCGMIRGFLDKHAKDDAAAADEDTSHESGDDNDDDEQSARAARARSLKVKRLRMAASI